MIKFILADSGEEIFFDGKINLVLYNPLFNDKITQSLTVRIINNRFNRKIFNYAHLPETRDNTISLDVVIVIDNIINLRGAIKITNNTKDFLDFNFIGQNDFWGRAGLMDMRDLNIPWLGRYFQFYNFNGFDEFPAPNKYNNILNSNSAQTQSAWVPCFNVSFLIKAIINSFGISVVKNEIEEDSSLSHIELACMNSNSGFSCSLDAIVKGGEMSDGDDNVYIVNSTAHGLSSNDMIYISGIRKVEKPPYSNGSYAQIIDLTTHSLIGLKSLVTVIDADNFSLDSLPIDVYGSVDDTEWQIRCFFSEVIINHSAVLTENNREHFPDMKVKDFLIECEKLTGTHIFIDESQNTARIIKLKSIINDKSYIDITNFAGVITNYQKIKKDGFLLSFGGGTDDFYSSQVIPDIDLTKLKSSVTRFSDLPMTGNTRGDIRLVTTLDAFYVWKEVVFVGISNWELLSQNFLQKKEGNGEYTINCNLVPMAEHRLIGTYIVSRVRTDTPVKFICFGDTPQSFFRPFLGYNSATYGHVCIRKRRYRIAANGMGEITFGNIDLDFNSEYSLYNQLYKEWVYFMVNNYSEMDMKVNWPEYLINGIDWTKKYKINNNLFYIKSIEIDASANITEFGNSVLIPAIH